MEFNETLFGRVDEYSSAKKPLFGKNGIYSGELISPQSKDFTSDENLFNYQAKIIRELAGKESCVIIGRCSNYILKDYPNVLRVFIHADWDFRMEKAAEKLSMSQKEIENSFRRMTNVRMSITADSQVRNGRMPLSMTCVWIAASLDMRNASKKLKIS